MSPWLHESAKLKALSQRAGTVVRLSWEWEDQIDVLHSQLQKPGLSVKVTPGLHWGLGDTQEFDVLYLSQCKKKKKEKKNTLNCCWCGSQALVGACGGTQVDGVIKCKYL